MKKYWILSLLTLAQISTNTFVQAADIKPESLTSFNAFMYSAEIGLTGPGPFHQMTLPLDVYQGVAGNDLGELRILNQQGEQIPHALLKTSTTPVSQDQRTQKQKTKVPLFPIIAAANDQDNISLSVRRNNDGTLISLSTSNPTETAKKPKLIRGMVFDTSQVKSKLQSMELEIGATNTPFHAFSIETSNDLQQWRLLKKNAQLVQLEHAGQRIEKNTVEWNSVSAKYLRLLWLAPEQAPEILSATVSSVPTATHKPQKTWSKPISPTALASEPAANHVYDYTFQGYLPLELLRIELAQTNTLAPMKIQQLISGKSPHKDYWINLTNTVVYRLQSPQGEVRSADIKLNRSAAKRLRLVVDDRSGGLGNGAPKLQIGFVPHTLVFLPRGEGPFTLNWGNAAIKNTALAISTLVPDYDQRHKSKTFLPSQAKLQLDTLKTNQAFTASKDSTSAATSKGVLWFVLIIGVLILAAMAWMLIQQIKQTEQTDSESPEASRPPPTPPAV